MFGRGMTVGMIGALCVVGVACQRESTANAPVTTTTPAGQSSAPPAAAVEERDNSLVRVVYAVPAGAAVDIYADDERVFDALSYKTVTAYRELPGERLSFKVRPAGMMQAEPLASNSEGLDDGDHYTVFVVPGDGTAAALRVVEDDHSFPSAGKARVRVVHASNDAGEVDVYAAGRRDPLFDGVNFQTVSSYNEIDPIVGAVTIRPDGQNEAMVSLREVRFDAGKTYTMVIVGRVRTAPRIDAFVIEDVATSAPAR